MTTLDDIDRRIINGLQGGFPISERPYAEAAAALGLDEADLISRLRVLIEGGVISRFGPLWNSEELGGAVCLAALHAPIERFDEVAELVNAFPEVAHNYERDHDLNMWFVLSSITPERIQAVAKAIETQTGLAVHLMPKEREFFIGFRVEA
jgi:DNA-binding Lrp family transcriptional regulator